MNSCKLVLLTEVSIVVLIDANGAFIFFNRSTNHSKPHAAEISSLILYPFDQSVATNLTINVSSARELFRILLYLAQELLEVFASRSQAKI